VKEVTDKVKTLENDKTKLKQDRGAVEEEYALLVSLDTPADYSS
jgi:hypothetical protein